MSSIPICNTCNQRGEKLRMLAGQLIKTWVCACPDGHVFNWSDPPEDKGSKDMLSIAIFGFPGVL